MGSTKPRAAEHSCHRTRSRTDHRRSDGRLAALPVRVAQLALVELAVGFARQVGAATIVRGLRSVTDFDYEYQMAGMNRQLMPEVETVFLTPSDQYQFVSGTFVREIAMLGGDVSKFVAPSVLERLKARVPKKA